MGQIGACPAEFWWALMTILCSTCIALEIASLATPRWFEQGSSTNHWQGGLLTPYPSETWYKDKTCDRDFHRNGFCDMFKNLWIGGIVYVVFESISLLFLTFSIVLYLIYLSKNSKSCVLVTFSVWISVIAHFIGFVTWAVLGKMLYEGSCPDVYKDFGRSPANICRKEGATLALLVILYIPLIAMLQSVLWYQSREKKEEVTEKQYKTPPENLSSRNENSSREFSSSQEYPSSRENVSESVEVSSN